MLYETTMTEQSPVVTAYTIKYHSFTETNRHYISTIFKKCSIANCCSFFRTMIISYQFLNNLVLSRQTIREVQAFGQAVFQAPSPSRAR
jgi:hypothetical protein